MTEDDLLEIEARWRWHNWKDRLGCAASNPMEAAGQDVKLLIEEVRKLKGLKPSSESS